MLLPSQSAIWRADTRVRELETDRVGLEKPWRGAHEALKERFEETVAVSRFGRRAPGTTPLAMLFPHASPSPELEQTGPRTVFVLVEYRDRDKPFRRKDA
jgi:hypothetical protein